MDNNFFKDCFDDENESEEEYEEDLGHNNKSNGKTFTKGFLTALAICIVAVGAAVWTTVNNVSSYLNPEVKTYSAEETDQDEVQSDAESAVSYIVESDTQVNATASKANGEVVFTFYPINSNNVLRDYSESLVYNETLGDYRAHPAIDYAADVDDKVRAMGSGTVKDIYSDDLLGNVVVIEHSESVCSYYCGLASTALVQKGDKVMAGDFVGTVYAIPCEAADKSHVHVAVKRNGQWINPVDLMRSSEN